jgi:Mn-dependent DtxR family transcriptional regulator
MRLNPIEQRVLDFLVESWSDEGGYWAFAGICANLQLERKQVRRACRSLARKGLAEYIRAGWSDEGPAGAGYGSTRAGRAFRGD